MSVTKRTLCIFVHFSKHDVIDDYVVYYVQSLLPHITDLVFVSASQLAETEVAKISPYAFKTIIRENIGYDFMSWQAGLNAVDYQSYDEVIIANDSCYAPIFSFAEMFGRMDSLDCDFWGNSQSSSICPHLQSYFVVFRKNVIVSDAFKKFWSNIQVEKDKLDIVRKYEVGLSQQLSAAGFKFLSYCSLGEAEDNKATLSQRIKSGYLLIKTGIEKLLNPVTRKSFFKYHLNLYLFVRVYRILVKPDNFFDTIYFYKKWLERRSPFMKVKMMDNEIYWDGQEKYIEDIQLSSTYDINLIRKHVKNNI